MGFYICYITFGVSSVCFITQRQKRNPPFRRMMGSYVVGERPRVVLQRLNMMRTGFSDDTNNHGHLTSISVRRLWRMVTVYRQRYACFLLLTTNYIGGG